MTDSALDQLCINTIRFLSIDSVQKARSGHPGAPMGAAPMAYVLWDRYLKHNPSDPRWPDRDRFVLSAGHASALLYSLLHLTGYDLAMEELQQFRQWGSRTPGHPEYGLTPGVEVTTGPLGQGLANAVGMALAERWLATRFNRPGHDVIDHYTYAIVSDGDLQEGVAAEAASLAGTLGLGKLILIYDDNQISIEGDTDIAFLEDVPARFQAYGWQVIDALDGNDLDSVASAIEEARAEGDRPSIIVCRTVIGYGSPNKAGTAGVHGAPLGDDEVGLTREMLHWPYPESFTVPGEAREHLAKARERGRELQEEWELTLSSYRENFPSEALRLQDALNGVLAPGWSSGISGLFEDTQSLSTREASGKVMNVIADAVPNLIGGSADLAPSTLTILNSEGHIGPGNFDGRNLHFGVREHAMGAVANGIAVHGGAIPYASTFLIFSDYLRPALRLSALMGQQVIYVFTHDSVALGEDGPTHQPVEHLMSLREMPNLVVIRPADATETAVAWQAALDRRDGPTALALSRQNLPVLDRSALASALDAASGAYVLWESPGWSADGGANQVIIIATGAEVHIALEAAQVLDAEGTRVRLVSMPSWELFEAQSQEYREAVLPPSQRKRLSVEAGATNGWARYVGLDGASVGMTTFGASAPGGVALERFGFTVARVVEEARKLVDGS